MSAQAYEDNAPTDVESLADHKRRFLIEQLRRNIGAVEINGCTFVWRGYGYNADRAQFATYLCMDCEREEIKDLLPALLDRMTAHSRSCKGRELQEG